MRRQLTVRDGLLWFVLSTLVVLDNVAMGDVGAPWWQTSIAVFAQHQQGHLPSPQRRPPGLRRERTGTGAQPTHPQHQDPPPTGIRSVKVSLVTLVLDDAGVLLDEEPRVRSHELTLGRSFGVTFDHGEDFFTALTEF